MINPNYSIPRPARGGAAAPLLSTQSGWFKVTNAFVSNGRLAAISGSAVKAYLVLLRLADRQGLAWPSMGTIGRLAGFTDRTAASAIDELLQHGLVLRQSGRTGRSNRYQLTGEDGPPPAGADNAALPIPETSPKPVSDQIGNSLPITSEADCSPLISLDPEPDTKLNQSEDELRNGKESDQNNQREASPIGQALLIDPIVPASKPPTLPKPGPGPHGPEGPVSRTPNPVVAPQAPPAVAEPTDRRPPWAGKYQPPTKEQKEKWDRYHEQRRAAAQKHRELAAESIRRVSERFATLTPAELTELKAKVLTQLPKSLAELLKTKDPLKSPTLSGLIAKELGMTPIVQEEK